MPGTPTKLGPFEGGLNDAGGIGEFIADNEVLDLVNFEVDLDKSLANRPAIKRLVTNLGSGTGGRLRVIGTYFPEAATESYLVVARGNGTVRLVNSETGVAFGDSPSVGSVVSIQYNNRAWVICTPGAGNGGYFNASGTWTTVTAIPHGESAVIYQNRMFIACGINATSDSSRMYYSEIKDPETWTLPGGSFVDVDAGNGEKLVGLVLLNNDLVLFKEHSTYRFGYSKNINAAEQTKINSNIGMPNAFCAVSYNNNSIYVLHDNSVYELYNFVYTRISQNVAMDQVTDLTLQATETYGLTLFRDRLFVRFYSNMYVFNLRNNTWSRWESNRKFSRVYTMPSASVGLDIGFASPGIQADDGSLYFFQDDRLDGVGGTGNTGESFNCRMVSKTYDFDVPQSYKVMFHWGATIATSGDTTFTVSVPSAGQSPTWGYLKANWTWGAAAAALQWGNASVVLDEVVIPPERGQYARKYLKVGTKKRRFRQIYFTIETEAKSNTVADASVRLFDLTAFLLERETVFRRTS